MRISLALREINAMPQFKSLLPGGSYPALAAITPTADNSPAGGDLDTTFTSGVSGSGASTAYVAAVQFDGPVLIGGDFLTVNGRSYPRLVRTQC